MEVYVFIFITLLIGIIGGTAALKLKIPAGAILGSTISVALFGIFSGKSVFPQEFNIIAQIGAGIFIGARIYKKDIMELKTMIRPAVIITVSMSLFSILMGILINANSDIDLITSLFASAPAGITDITLISLDFGADTSIVAVLHFARLISIITIMPGFIKYFVSKTGKALKNDNLCKDLSVTVDTDDSLFNRTVYTLIAGTIFGYIGYLSGIPAGTLSFSMIACAMYNIITSKAYVPVNMRKFIQFLGGTFIGAKVTMEQVTGMKELLPVILIIIIGNILLTFVLAFIMTKYSNLDITTALYSSSPGGLTDMCIIASEMGADASKVATLHLVRIFSIIVLYPLVIKLLLNFIH